MDCRWGRIRSSPESTGSGVDPVPLGLVEEGGKERKAPDDEDEAYSEGDAVKEIGHGWDPGLVAVAAFFEVEVVGFVCVEVGVSCCGRSEEGEGVVLPDVGEANVLGDEEGPDYGVGWDGVFS